MDPQKIVVFQSASDEFWYEAVKSGLAWEIICWGVGTVFMFVLTAWIYNKIHGSNHRRWR